MAQQEYGWHKWLQVWHKNIKIEATTSSWHNRYMHGARAYIMEQEEYPMTQEGSSWRKRNPSWNKRGHYGARGNVMAQEHPFWPVPLTYGTTRSPCCSISLPSAPNLFQVLQTPFFMIRSFIIPFSDDLFLSHMLYEPQVLHWVPSAPNDPWTWSKCSMNMI